MNAERSALAASLLQLRLELIRMQVRELAERIKQL
jgi:hypothetical protein